MASWRMQRRLLSLFTSSRRPQISFPNDSKSSFFKNQIRPLSKLHVPTIKTSEENESSSPKSTENSTKVTFTAKSELKISPRHDLAMMFTCKVCETRSVKTISRESYEKGVVVARCGGCNNYHLIADHLGMFGEKGCIEDTLAARGEEVRRGDSDTLNLTLEDLVGMAKS